MNDHKIEVKEISALRFWTVFGSLIIILIVGAFSMSNRMAVNEEKLQQLETKVKDTNREISEYQKEIKEMNKLLIEISTNQKRILKKLE